MIVGVRVAVGTTVFVGVRVIVGVRVTVGVFVGVDVFVGVGTPAKISPRKRLHAESLNCTDKPNWFDVKFKGALLNRPSKPPFQLMVMLLAFTPVSTSRGKLRLAAVVDV